MIIANIYGRAARDARQFTTKSSKPMTSVRLAVDVAGRDAGEQTLWADVIAFGRLAEDLAAVQKGGMVSAIGRLSRGEYTTQAGETREQWTLIADGLVTAKSARPGGRKPTETGQDGHGTRHRRRHLTSTTTSRFED